MKLFLKTIGSDSKESACNAGDSSSMPGSGRSPGEGHGNLLQYSCPENPMDRGAWWASVHRAAQSWTQLKQLCTHTLDNILKLGKEKGAGFLKKMPI